MIGLEALELSWLQASNSLLNPIKNDRFGGLGAQPAPNLSFLIGFSKENGAEAGSGHRGSKPIILNRLQ